MTLRVFRGDRFCYEKFLLQQYALDNGNQNMLIRRDALEYVSKISSVGYQSRMTSSVMKLSSILALTNKVFSIELVDPQWNRILEATKTFQLTRLY
jgi:hypothetical protein